MVSDWPHAPVHRLDERGSYMVTAGTYHKTDFFNTPEKLSLVRDRLFVLANEHEWRLQAWAILANHYHFIAISPRDPGSLKVFISTLHTSTARILNHLDGMSGRRVWYEFWDSHITYQRSYLARLNYVHNNPVHHGIVRVAMEYPYCSAWWFQQNANRAFQKTVASFKTDRLNVRDDF